MRCFHLLVCLTLALTLSAPAEAGGSYGSYGSHGSRGSSGGYVHGSSGGGLLSGLRARIAARHSGSSGGASYGGSSGGSYSASYASAGSSGGSSGGGLFSRLRARIQARRAARASSGGSSGGYTTTAYYSSGGASYGGGSSGGASYGGGSSGGYYSSNSVAVTPVSYGNTGSYHSPVGYAAPVSPTAPIIYGTPMNQSSYPVESYPSGPVIDSSSQPSEGSGNQNESSSNGGATIEGKVLDSGASYESRKPILDDDAALLTVAVPVESAHVTVNGHETSSDGMVRQFMSRGLKDGYLYTYEVVITYDVEGAEQRESKTIKLRPGDMERMVFHRSSRETIGAGEAELDADATNSDDAASETGAAEIETVVQLHVPANAVVTLAGNPIPGNGRVRTFRTTQLAPGEAWEDYTVVVSAKVNGREIRNERIINVDAGSTIELDFHADKLAMQ